MDINYSGISAQQVLNMVESYIVPVGGVIPWLKNLSGTPSLPAYFVECNGQTISDGDSVYDGVTIPDLNGDNRFLRGNATSGSTGGSDTHALSVAELAAHTHTLGEGSGGGTDTVEHSRNTSIVDTQATSSTGSGTAHENRPAYYEVVWVMRIK